LGESILYAVLAGDRKVKQGAVGSGLHQADQDLHSPSKLAEIGAEQGAYALLGPVGFGVDAFRMMHKGNNGNSPRVLTATLLADDKSEATMQQFLDALDDRDSFVRAAAARQLGDYRGKQVTDALQGAFDDPEAGSTAHGRRLLHSRKPAHDYQAKAPPPKRTGIEEFTSPALNLGQATVHPPA